MNQGAQTWGCGELGRKGIRKERLKDGIKEGEHCTVHKHKHSHRGAENNEKLPLSLHFASTPSDEV